MTESDIPVSEGPVRMLGFLLVNDFPLMAYAAIVESFRAANALAGRTLYRWAHVSVDGRPCLASNGATIIPDLTVADRAACDTIFIVAGGDPTLFADTRTFAWLRAVAQTNSMIVGVSGGAYVMARAGLLEGRRATIHWEYREAFVDAFPSTLCEPGLYVFDGRRVTCAGGLAGMDLAVEMIEREHGRPLAIAVSDWFIRSGTRAPSQPQRAGLRDRYGTANERVLRALALMEDQVEDPASREAIARVSGVGVRQLERLFRAHLGHGIGATYLRIRLDRAEQLLRSTSLTATMVAVASGFASASDFSRAFRRRFGRSPSNRPGSTRRGR